MPHYLSFPQVVSGNPALRQAQGDNGVMVSLPDGRQACRTMDARLRTSGMTDKVLCGFTNDPISSYLRAMR